MNELINIEEAVYRFPLSLRGIKNEVLINAVNNFLPYSTGFEIECYQKDTFDVQAFLKISNIIDVDCDGGEQRFRIPNGIDGLICLYEICKNLKIHSEINEGSGIHYHIDMTKTFDLLNQEIIDKNKEWILSELDTWEDAKSTGQSRDCRIDVRCYVQFQTQFKTAEIRIGAQSFDYSFIIKRIIHCNEIVRRFNEILLCTPNEMRIKKMSLQLEQLNKIPVINDDPDQYQMKQVINNRTIKLNGRK